MRRSQHHGYAENRTPNRVCGYVKTALTRDHDLPKAAARCATTIASSASSCAREVGGRLFDGQLEAGGQLAGGLLLAALVENNALAEGIDWEAITASGQRIAQQAGKTASEIACQVEPVDPYAMTTGRR